MRTHGHAAQAIRFSIGDCNAWKYNNMTEAHSAYCEIDQMHVLSVFLTLIRTHTDINDHMRAQS